MVLLLRLGTHVEKMDSGFKKITLSNKITYLVRSKSRGILMLCLCHLVIVAERALEIELLTKTSREHLGVLVF